eukprot:gnl/Trimastix_PCT/157.p1 GENE.gnl/Trimastix_PCT/157~~gnl/Trimastix_PCT/157.p1  ORF type:complete len:188 (-),score=27.15 gnl/Trimastix_PCT/157:24-587(-)
MQAETTLGLGCSSFGHAQLQKTQGLAWAQDHSRFGFKLLEKMGWKQGTGLGKEGQGSQTHVHIPVKSDHLGIGASKSEDAWLENISAYGSILSKLSTSKQNQSQDKPKSKKKGLGRFSRVSRWTDVSTYSNTELAQVMGSLNKLTPEVLEPEMAPAAPDAKRDRSKRRTKEPSSKRTHRRKRARKEE